MAGLSNLDRPRRPSEKNIKLAQALAGKKCKDPGSGTEIPCSCLPAASLEKDDFGDGVKELVQAALQSEAPTPQLNVLAAALLGYQCMADSLNMINSYVATHAGKAITRGAAGIQAAAVPGTGQTIGLLEFDNFHTSDVQDFLKLIGYPGRISQLSEADVDGGAGAPGPGESEVLLDIDAVMSLAPGANVAVFDAPFDGRGTSYEDVFNAMIDGGVTIISNSWASCEDEVPLADAQGIDAVLQNAAAAGISVFNGAGDSGSTCLDGSPSTIAVPADSPNATAVGGTSLTLDEAGTYGEESWWDSSTGTPPGGQGGFGVSEFFAAPAYQSAISGSAMRSVPNVAAPADPAGAYFTICQADKGGCPNGLLYGGTSVATPIWAAIVAVLNEQLGQNVGLLNSQAYPLAGGPAFHSAASMGTDFAHVGLGSPNVAELHRLLSGGIVGPVSTANSAIVEAGWVPPADGATHVGVAVILMDSNFNSVAGQAVTLGANAGSSAVITAVNATSDQNNGAARFTITDTAPETVTLTANTAPEPWPTPQRSTS